MNKYAEDCIALDAARRKLLESVRKAYKNLWLVERRVRTMYGHAMSAESQAALVEQRKKLEGISPYLGDFIDYMDEPRAWAPAEEKQEVGFDSVAPNPEYCPECGYLLVDGACEGCRRIDMGFPIDNSDGLDNPDIVGEMQAMNDLIRKGGEPGAAELGDILQGGIDDE